MKMDSQASTWHIQSRGVNPAANGTPLPAFPSDTLSIAFLEILDRRAREGGLKVLAYSMLATQVDVVVRAENDASVSSAFDAVFALYAQYTHTEQNQDYVVWMGRYDARMVEDGLTSSLLACVENSPVRHGLARRAAEYAWSSARAHLGLEGDPELVERGLFSDLLDLPWFRQRWDGLAWAKILDETQVAEAIAGVAVSTPARVRPTQRAPRARQKAAGRLQ